MHPNQFFFRLLHIILYLIKREVRHCNSEARYFFVIMSFRICPYASTLYCAKPYNNNIELKTVDTRNK